MATTSSNPASKETAAEKRAAERPTWDEYFREIVQVT